MAYFPGVGTFEQLFGSSRGEFEHYFSKNSNARGGGGMLKLRFDWYITVAKATYFTWGKIFPFLSQNEAQSSGFKTS